MKKNQLGLVVGGMAASLSGILLYTYLLKKELALRNQKVNKFKDYYTLTNRWLLLKEEDKKLETYFEQQGIYTIAIYGVGELGKRLMKELNKSKIQVIYAIDKESGGSFMGISVLDYKDKLAHVDAIIVTPVFDFDKIKQELNNITSARIISLMDILYSI